MNSAEHYYICVKAWVILFCCQPGAAAKCRWCRGYRSQISLRWKNK